MLVALKRASCRLSLVALKRTGCDVWQVECQASNVTARVQSDHLLANTSFQSFLTLRGCTHSTPRCAGIQPMLQ